MGVHTGHRARLKRRLEREGLDAFQPHEALELLLFHTVARRDVNPLAHALIDRFGSLHGALEAGFAALSAVPGVGARTAALLSFMPDFIDFYRAQSLLDQPRIQNLREARAFCRHLIGDRTDGTGGTGGGTSKDGAGDGGTGDGEPGKGGTGDGEPGKGETGDGEPGKGGTGDGEPGDGEPGDGEPGDRLWLLHLNAVGGVNLTESLSAEDGYPRPKQVVERVIASRAQALILAARRKDANITAQDGAFVGAMRELLPMVGVSLMDILLLDGDKSISLRREGLLGARPGESGRANLNEPGWLPEDE